MRTRAPLAVLLLSCLGACAPRSGPVAPAARGTGEAATCVPAGTWIAPRTRERLTAADVTARAAAARVVLLGERHEQADHHRWQLHVVAALQAARPDLVLGFEAFPRRVQPALDRWIAGAVDERTFLVESDWAAVWGFDPALYLPLFHFARMHGVPLRALNVERALVSRVGEAGLAAVPEAEREGVGAPAAAGPEYEALLTQVFDAHPGERTAADGDARRRFVEAQLTWDRAMAEALAAAAAAQPDALVVGVMGSGHVERRFGVPHQLAALGVRDVVVLLPWDAARDCSQLTPDVADAVFGIAGDHAGAAADTPRLGVLIAPGDGGVRVADVPAGTIAATAGLRRDDVVVRAAGVPVRTPGDLRAVVERQAPGTWLPLAVRRGGRVRELVAKFPAADGP